MALPTSAWLKGKGRVRVVDEPDMRSKGYIKVITKRDETVFVKREDLVFTKGRG